MCKLYQSLAEPNIKFILFCTRRLKWVGDKPIIKDRAYSLLLAGYINRFGRPGISKEVVLAIMRDRDQLNARFQEGGERIVTDFDNRADRNGANGYRNKPPCVTRPKNRRPDRVLVG